MIKIVCLGFFLFSSVFTFAQSVLQDSIEYYTQQADSSANLSEKLPMLLRAADFAEELNDSEKLIVIYSEIVRTYNYHADYDKAMEYIYKQKNIISDLSKSDTTQIIRLLLAESNIYYDLSDFNKNRKVLDEAFRYATEANLDKEITNIYFCSSQSYIATEQYDLAEEELEKYYQSIVSGAYGD